MGSTLRTWTIINNVRMDYLTKSKSKNLKIYGKCADLTDKFCYLGLKCCLLSQGSLTCKRNV